MKKKVSLLIVASVLTAALFANGTEENPASATPDWPTKPIHIIVQAAAGAGPDLFVREMQPILQKELGTSIVVENKAGSGGKIAAEYVWNAEPDGYTLLAHSSPLTTVTQISKNCEYSIREMKHIASFDSAPYAVIVKSDSPYNSIQDLINASKTTKISNANSGIGGAMYLQSRIMADALGIDYSEVPYNGTNPCVLAVMNGDVTFTIAGSEAAVNNDKVKAICVLSNTRNKFMPDVPTVSEQGFTFPFLTMRRGIIVPKDTPDSVCEKLIAAFKTALNDPTFQEYAQNNGIQLEPLYGDDYQKTDEEYYETIMKFIDYLK